MLKNDHRTVEDLFKRFEQAGDRAFVEKRTIVDRIIEELSVHAAIEEQLFYPVTRATVPAVEDDALESLEEHHIVKWVLSELEHMDPEDERFDAKVTVLIENVRHHVEEEESDYFREVRDALGRKALTELGDAMAAARETAPTRPHPRSPDTPPGNVLVGAAAGMADRLGATVSGIAQGGVAVAQDVADRVRGRDRTRPSPTGPRRARATADSVRAGADDAVERLIAVAREATAGGEKVAGTAARQVKAGGEKVAGTAAREAKAGGEKVAGTAAREAKASGRKVAGAARSGAGRTAKAARTPAGKRSPRAR